MPRRTAALTPAALYLLPLGQHLLLGTLGVIAATTAVVLHHGAADAQDATAYNNRGNTKNRLKDYQGAIADYNKAIELDPQYVSPYINRGNAKDSLKDYQGAIADFSKAIEIDPQNTNAYHNRAIPKRKLKDYQGACADYKKAASLGNQLTTQFLNSEGGAWCRNMR